MARALLARGERVVFTGGPDERELVATAADLLAGGMQETGSRYTVDG